jgi:hypothetical protein
VTAIDVPRRSAGTPFAEAQAVPTDSSRQEIDTMEHPSRSDDGVRSAPDNLIDNPLDKPKRHPREGDDERSATPPDEDDGDNDNLITNPLDKPGARDNLIKNPLDKD